MHDIKKVVPSVAGGTIFFVPVGWRLYGFWLVAEAAVGILVHEGLGVGDVVLSIGGLTGTGGLNILGGYAAPDFASGNLGVLQDQGSGGDDGAFANLAAVE